MQKRDRTLLIALLLWGGLIGLSFSLNDYLFRNRLEGYAQESFGMLLRWDAVYWVMWVLLAWLVIFPVARRFPLGRRGLARNLLITVVAGLVLAVLHRIIYLWIATWIQKVMGYQTPFASWLILYNLPLGFMSYSVILLIKLVTDYAFSKREEARLSRAEAEASRLKAELKLRPHFIFNALNSIATQVRKDPGKADEMIAKLGDFLRVTLNYAEVQTVSLEEELKITRSYLAIEEVRLGDALHVREDVEPQTLIAQVPTFVLQPTVENAIKHRQSFEQVQIVISASREGGRLHMQVKDNGDRWQGSVRAGGTGIENTRARIEGVHGSDYRFDLRRGTDGWTAATLEMPFVTAAEHPVAAISRL